MICFFNKKILQSTLHLSFVVNMFFPKPTMNNSYCVETQKSSTKLADSFSSLSKCEFKSEFLNLSLPIFIRHSLVVFEVMNRFSRGLCEGRGERCFLEV